MGETGHDPHSFRTWLKKPSLVTVDVDGAGWSRAIIVRLLSLPVPALYRYDD